MNLQLSLLQREILNVIISGNLKLNLTAVPQFYVGM